jgi:hypothetical protein
MIVRRHNRRSHEWYASERIYELVCLWLYSHFAGPVPCFQSIGLLGRGISPSLGRYLHTEQHKHNKHTQTSMSWVRFEPTILAFERAKTVHAFNRSATVTGNSRAYNVIILIYVGHSRGIFCLCGVSAYISSDESFLHLLVSCGFVCACPQTSLSPYKWSR